MYTMKITIMYIYEKLIFFVGDRCHEKGKIVMIYIETTHNRLSINVFLSAIHKKYHEKCQ